MCEAVNTACCGPANQRTSWRLAGQRSGTALTRRSIVAFVGAALLAGSAAARDFDLRIVKRRLLRSGQTIRVNQGESVLLRWHSDEAVSLHLHGYDLQLQVSASEPAAMRFDAGVAGRFPISTHGFGAGGHAGAAGHRETTLLYLEVLPR
jgi:FtsP/CotA-like multicopper oxidase with cupredoxin domain